MRYGGYIEEGAYRYTCRNVDGCVISGRTVLTGPIEQTPGGSLSTGSEEDDRAALVALYRATDGAGWTNNDNWLSDMPLGEWYGVATDNNSRVTVLTLGRNQLTGFIPPELGRLTNLLFLNLGNNRLSGPIPSGIGQLEQLRDLSLNHNELTGAIPLELGQLGNLNWLMLFGNKLSGPIPPELGQLTNLSYLNLGDNRLSGPIPSEIGQLEQLQSLSLSHNELTGAIPSWVGQLEKLQSLGLINNELTGAIPSELGQLINLRFLNLNNNRLSGSIPSEIGQLGQLKRLFLQHNELTGAIPSELRQLTNLDRLDLSNNRLSGSIPSWIGQLEQLQRLYLQHNELTGTIPPELGHLSALGQLDLSGNRLSGRIPPSLGSLPFLRELFLTGNQLTGTLPWAFSERVSRGELTLRFGGNLITGYGPPTPRSTRPVFAANPVENGNVSHHSVAYYQGPLVWEWNWQDEPVEYQQPLLGRWAALAVRVEHEVEAPPPVITRVLDSEDEVLAERLTEAAAPVTTSTAADIWRTEYVFELPGSLYRSGNKIVHVIDPDNEMAETDEDDNVGEVIALYGEQPPQIRVTFVPFFHATDAEPPALDADALMAGIRALLPIADDFDAVVRSPIQSDASGKFELLDEVQALWNAEADPDEFYHGVFVGSWSGDGEAAALGGGVAIQPGRVAVSELSVHSTIPHELGHNLSLRHPPGCGANLVDESYPYPNGGLGPNPGWDMNWRRFVSSADEGSADVMSACGRQFLVSDYHYRKALDYWLSTASESTESSVLPIMQMGGASQQAPGIASPSPASPDQAILELHEEGGLALSGRIDASGAWSLNHAQSTEKAPRPPAPHGTLTLILYDAGGVELYREALAVMTLSEGSEAGWAARTPRPTSPAREAVILNAAGVEVLRGALPAIE